MRNISFDNPYLLLLAIPLLAAVIVPFAIAIRKDNASKSVAAALALHLLMVVCITLGAAGLTYTTVMTETNVYVVADISYSLQSRLDTVDEYILSVKKSLPGNSKMGVVCFGRDQAVCTPMGGSVVSVKKAEVDESATDIAAALEYTAGLFGNDVIKRIVLITDGNETLSSSSGGLIAAVENLDRKDIRLDAIYLDTNLAEDVDEVQISDVGFTERTYKNHETSADILVQSNRDASAIVNLYRGDEKISGRAVSLTKGYNIVNFPLDASEPGTFDYRFEISADGDRTSQNNAYSFTQRVEDKLEILLLTQSSADLEKASALYGERANIDAPLVVNGGGKPGKIPFTIEQLCKYDEIVISDFDVRTLTDRTAFMESLDQAVSLFGKSLITIGNTNIQNMTEEDDALANLENMLPVKFGNSAREPRLYAIILDISRSLSHAYTYQLVLAKKAAKQILNLLSDDDYVMIAPFFGEVTIAQSPTPAKNRDQIAELIENFQPTQGTMLGPAMNAAYDVLLENQLNFSAKEAYVISDGLTSDTDMVDHAGLAAERKENGIVTSSIYVYRPGNTEPGQNTGNENAVRRLKDIAERGGGKYFVIDNNNSDEIILNEVAENVTGSVVNRVSEVAIRRENDGVLQGIASLPQISGFITSKAKASAKTVLTTEYLKDSGATESMPVYAYWNYGNGRVSSFTSSFTGDWVSEWENDSRASAFFVNVLKENTPKEKNAEPYTLSLVASDTKTEIELTPVHLNAYAKVKAKLIRPDGETELQLLAFDSQKYVYKFDTLQLGRYELQLTYWDDETSVSSTICFNLSYHKEYDSFATSDISNLKDAVRNLGTVHTDGNIDMKNDGAEVARYEVHCTIPLLIVAAALFIVDIVVRKMKLEDFKMLFKRTGKGGDKS